MNTEVTKIKEIFASTQGEGPYVGYKQLFVRFCGCNLSCDFCDTNFGADNSVVYTPTTLRDYIETNFNLAELHSISYTGGEPLLNVEFLKRFLPVVDKLAYLETNATLASCLQEVLAQIDIISADIKLPSATRVDGTFEKHDEFFGVARSNSDVELFAKVVFDEKITDDEINLTQKLAKKYDIPLILQPKTNIDGGLPSIGFIENVFDKFLKGYQNVRLIPQVHKFLDIR